MSPLPKSIYSAAQTRAIDRRAIGELSIPGYELMCRAAAAALGDTVRSYPGAERAVVVCGAGNNGGDGYVFARLARQAGLSVEVVAVADPERLTGDAARAFAEFTQHGGVARTDMNSKSVSAGVLIVDAIFGTGLKRDVTGKYADAIRTINESACPVVALDIPSGLDADSGAIRGCAVRADMTVTFVGLKSGLFLASGPELCGQISFSDLGLPAAAFADSPRALRRLASSDISEWLPPRSRDAHKGDFGHVLVVGGGPGMAGAARLTGEACLRSGAGLVTLATHPVHVHAISAARPEVMCRGVTCGDDLTPLLERATVVALGPGLGTDTWAREIYAAVVGSDLPLVIDADALNLLAQSPRTVTRAVLTPHPGEAARLLGTRISAIQHDRLAAVRALSERFGAVSVLKGAGTLIHEPGRTVRLCTAGNPGMAAPGMGDALTGIIAAMLAQRLSAFDAASVGVLVHALAGDTAAQHGERGLCALDLIDQIRKWVN